MNLELKRFQISRVGTHRDSMGRTHSFHAQRLQDAANEYNQRISNGKSRAPLYIGHPAQTGQRNPLGLVNKLEFKNGKLYAIAYVTDKLRDLIRGKVYRAVSAGFHAIGKFGDKLELDHIAFLNNPAIKGMEPLNFSEKDGLIMFSELLTTDFSEDTNALHAAALAFQSKHGGEYVDAVCACLSQQAADFSESLHEPESNALHHEILERQSAFGGTYEDNLAAIQLQRVRGF